MGTVLTVVVVVAGIALLTLFAGGPARERGLRRPLGVLFDTSIPPEHETRGIPRHRRRSPSGA